MQSQSTDQSHMSTITFDPAEAHAALARSFQPYYDQFTNGQQPTAGEKRSGDESMDSVSKRFHHSSPYETEAYAMS